MLLVNNVALDSATPAQLQHAAWGAGVHLADFVYPWFLFCVGVAIPYAMASLRRKGVPAWRVDLKILSRAALLVLFGLLIDSSIQHRPVFTLGVLQTIGLAYLIAALLYELPFTRRLLIAGIMLAGYGAALTYIHVPGGFDATHNVVYALNYHYLNGVNLWGLPSVVPTSVLVLLGAAFGDLLRWERLAPWGKLAMLMGAGAVLMGLGYLWSLHLLLNKGLWTPSYILLTAGSGAVLLGFLYLAIDLPRWPWLAYPLLVFGANAILAYIAPILTKLWVLQVWTARAADGTRLSLDQWYLHQVKTAHGPIIGGWIYTIGWIVLWWLVLLVLYRKKIFLRV
jgi:predicted acyltransferase